LSATGNHSYIEDTADDFKISQINQYDGLKHQFVANYDPVEPMISAD